MLSFLNPVLLFGLAGLAIPILIHLVNRQRAVPLRFSSIRFIKRTTLQQKNRRSLTDLLLLLLRLAFLAAVIIALAGPRWEPEPEGLQAGNEIEETVIFVVDASSSLSGWGGWEESMSTFRTQLAAFPDDTEVGLVVFGKGVLAELAPTLNRSLVENTLLTMYPEQTEGVPGLGIKRALELLGSAPGRRIVVLSDFQLSTWQSDMLPDIDSGTRIDFVGVGNFDQPNFSILSVDSFASREGGTRLVARVKNDSPEPAEIPVRLQVRGAELEEVTRFSPGQIQPVAFKVAEGSGTEGRLFLPEDAYLKDNEYRLWMGPTPSTNVLVVIPFEAEPEKLDEADFVSKALSVEILGGANQYFVSGSDVSVDIGALIGKVDALYLAGSVPYFSEEQMEDLQRYLEAGGTAFVTPGKMAAKQHQKLREQGLSEMTYVGRSKSTAERVVPHHVGWINPDSDLGKLFDEEAAVDLYQMGINRYTRFRAGEGAEVLLRSEDGDPLFVRERVGKGTLLTSAWSWDARSSDLPLRFSFLPLLRESLAGAMGDKEGTIRLKCGDLLSPEYLPEGASPSDSEYYLLTVEPNVFVLNNTPFEVNVSRVESVSQRAVLSDLRAQLFQNAKIVSTLESDSALDLNIRSLWLYFVMAATLLYLIETILSGYIDSRSSHEAHA
ncbi:BatA domain-containing protein [Candidatus Pelagisphaera phototrophica]|uniref:BatA domain-containing protein n=1 Tax=Candidatus Pelagisphaera phototrophica TaxID=2684113 RepID=UPI0019F3E9FB|nr:BatA domain-containing protein [Candidatus Pelagisphaera phototrophica]QXD33032.1 BatA domain-containing protein [Candidatus Pelagisphaera phototrophica]